MHLMRAVISFDPEKGRWAQWAFRMIFMRLRGYKRTDLRDGARLSHLPEEGEENWSGGQLMPKVSHEAILDPIDVQGYAASLPQQNEKQGTTTPRALAGDMSVLTERQVQVVALRNKGWTQSEIARHLSVALNTVTEVLRVAQKRLTGGPDKRRVDSSLVQRVKEMKQSGLPYKEIAKRLNVTARTARRYATERK